MGKNSRVFLGGAEFDEEAILQIAFVLCALQSSGRRLQSSADMILVVLYLKITVK